MSNINFDSQNKHRSRSAFLINDLFLNSFQKIHYRLKIVNDNVEITKNLWAKYNWILQKLREKMKLNSNMTLWNKNIIIDKQIYSNWHANITQKSQMKFQINKIDHEIS